MNDTEQIRFEQLPQITFALQNEMKAVRAALDEVLLRLDRPSKAPTNELIGIEEACQLLCMKKPTVYRKAQQKEIPSYKPKGCKKLMFKRSDLMQWISSNLSEDHSNSSFDELFSEIQQGIKHRPKSVVR